MPGSMRHQQDISSHDMDYAEYFLRKKYEKISYEYAGPMDNIRPQIYVCCLWD